MVKFEVYTDPKHIMNITIIDLKLWNLIPEIVKIKIFPKIEKNIEILGIYVYFEDVKFSKNFRILEIKIANFFSFR